jgi:hypothetical protein
METTMSINVTIPLADRYAAAKAAADAAVEALEALKEEIKALGMPVLHGITCDLTLDLAEQRRVDNKALKQFMTDEQIEACKKPVLMHRITVKAKGL